MSSYFATDRPIYFVFPIDGDCVNERDGKITENGLLLPVTVKAKKGCEILVNGIKATETEEGIYKADVEITGYRNTLVAQDKTNDCEHRIAIYRLKDVTMKYRISSDDNIIFLQDINNNKDVYKSIFENPYLAMYKKAHDLYDAKVHLNLFYEFDEKSRSYFNPSFEYFNLSMMTDKFKDEFKANSDWLKLAFHAKSEFPDSPYENTTREKITKECIQILREIIRFAGPDSISDSTTVHWGAVNKEGVRALRTLGFRSLTGYFEHTKHGDPLVSYYAPDDLIDHIGARDFFYDKDEDMFYGRIDEVMNTEKEFDDVIRHVKEAEEDEHRGGFVSIMIHEQYFHKGYFCYRPDFVNRVLESAKYLYDRGYRGMFISDAIKEPHLNENPKFF